MSDLRCTCGAFAKIEAALERIKKSKDGIYKIIYDFNRDAQWETLEALEAPNIYHQVRLDKSCTLPAAIMELADKVKPPPQKEREWRVGDVVELVEPLAYEQFKVGMKAVLGDLAIRPPESWPTNIKHPDSVSLSLHAGPKNWRNLTIEAEQAGK
ncbi:hypothetical protein LCGC14_2409070 [marine sediment metagenome]|uniref:Uncharacterized protein n=1 Tax=marine sediment metagenome TaxID=412755 RepID=A0A0F9EMF9_9ZZZZ